MPIPRRILFGLALGATAATAASISTSCDDITTGQLPDDPGPPVLTHVLIQDLTFAGGRRMATDLLEADTPAGEKCTTRDPCPAGEAYQSLHCHFPDPAVDDGICPRPLRPQETPAPITSKRLAGTQIRIVLSKVLANNTDSTRYDTEAKAIVYDLKPEIKSSIGLFDENGKEVVVDDKYYDPAGSPNDTSDLFFTPYGPALVIKLKTALTPLKKYSIRFDRTLLKDKKGQAVDANDRLGHPVKGEYPFTVEDFYIIDPDNGGGNVGFNQLKREPGGQKIKPEQAVVLFSNCPFDPFSIKATVRDANGKEVKVEAGAEVGFRPVYCDDFRSSERINIVHVDDKGHEAKWDVGIYTVDLFATAQEVPGLALKADNLGKSPFTGVKFEVKVALPEEKYDPVKDPFAVIDGEGNSLIMGQLLKPSACPTDGGVYQLPDLGGLPQPPDMAGASPPDLTSNAD
jgi:hypothetical protein